MIIVHVKHYLNNDGKKYFDNEWFPSVNNAISNQPGFLSITSQWNKENPELVHITLKFDTTETLENWIKTPIHGQLVDLLDPHRTRSWQAVRTTDEATDPETLTWKDITAKFIT